MLKPSTLIAPVVVSLLCCLLFQRAINDKETQWRDRLMLEASRSVPVDERIVMITIDDTTLEALRTPPTYWAPYFAKAIAGLVKANCQSVGLDFLCEDQDPAIYKALAPFYPGLDASGESPWLPVVEAFEGVATDKPGPFVQGLISRTDEARLHAPVASLTLAAITGGDVFGLVNLDTDPDLVWRSQRVYPTRLPPNLRPQFGVENYRMFATRLLEPGIGRAVDLEHPEIGSAAPLLNPHQAVTINYLSPSQTKQFPRVSFSKLLQQCDDPAAMQKAYAQKVVIIGATSRLFQDFINTPVGEMPGMQGHANLVNTLATGSYIRECTPTQTWVGIGIAALLACLVAIQLPLMAAVLVELSTTYVAATAGWWAFSNSSWFLPIWTWMVASWASWTVAALIKSRYKSIELGRVRHLFGRYVSPQVMENILKDAKQATLGAIGKRKITVLFTDINGFSGECEKRTSAEILDMLNAYFQEMNEIIFRYQGTIKQFVGDEIMAMYGAPTVHPEPEVAAVETALAMITRLNELRERDPGRKRGFYEIKIGIHAGPVILGNVGSATRTEYAAVGDDVNLGSRIMGMTKAMECDILVSREIYEKAKHLKHAKFTPKGSHPVKGRKEPVELFALEANHER